MKNPHRNYSWINIIVAVSIIFALVISVSIAVGYWTGGFTRGLDNPRIWSLPWGIP
jgi:hypothetical protein